MEKTLLTQLFQLKHLKKWKLVEIEMDVNIQKDNGEVLFIFLGYYNYVLTTMHMWKGKVDSFSMNGLLIGPAIEADYKDGKEFDFEEVDSNDVTIFDERSEEQPAPSWKVFQKDWEAEFPPIKEISNFFNSIIKKRYEQIIKKTTKLNKFCEKFTKLNLLKYCELGVHDYDGELSLTATIRSDNLRDELFEITLTDEHSQYSYEGNRYSFRIDFSVEEYEYFYFSETEIEIAQMPVILNFIEELRQKTLHLWNEEECNGYQKPEETSPENIKEIISQLQKILEE
ncbi:MAG TPA: hypothetical protein DDW20_01445 [Firmicutes bacterium]|nr:hypothetical protein [Bacillota bacterium]